MKLNNRTECHNPILNTPHVLESVEEYLRATGFAGNCGAPMIAYLTLTSRMFDRPLNIAITGPSSAGKTHVVKSILGLFPTEAFYDLAGSSPMALMYSKESFEHRTVIIGESTALHRDGIGASLMRNLISESELKYDTVDNNRQALQLRKKGPTGFITTSTHALEGELSTRLWEVPVPDGSQQTREVMQAVARIASGTPGPQISEGKVREFVDAQEWLAKLGRRNVIVPFADSLAALLPDNVVRLRRDFTQLLTFIRTHAFLHQLRRDLDSDGRIIATVQDYEAIRDLTGAAFDSAISQGATQEMRETVEAVRKLSDLGKPVTFKAVGNEIGLCASGAFHRVGRAIERGWIANQQQRPHQPAALVIGEPLPDETPGLPRAEDLFNHSHAAELQVTEGVAVTPRLDV